MNWQADSYRVSAARIGKRWRFSAWHKTADGWERLGTWDTAAAAKLRAFMEQTGIALEPNCGIDTAVYRDDWHGVSVVCEIVIAEFAQPRAAAAPGEQIDLFGEAA